MTTALMRGVSGSTYPVTSTNSAVGLAAGVLIDTTMGPIDRVTLTCETNNIRVAIGTATQAGTGELLYPGDSIEIEGNADCKAVTWISAANGVHGVLQVTPKYFYGGRS